MAKKYKIGDFLIRIKRPIKLIPDQDYRLVTIKMNHKGVVLREEKKGALIKSNMYEVNKGDFILSGIDARNGAFGIVPEELDGAIVTNDFWYFKIDANIISKRLFLELTATTWFDEICNRGSDGTTQRIRLQKDKFFNQKISLPEGFEQEKLLSKLLSFKENQANLTAEIQIQKSLLTQLKQAVLQEAIQGKLTGDWRAQNPELITGENSATTLLENIKAEKARLVKEKKIKKEKPLPPIEKEEIPFELPDGWIWCRLGDINNIFLGGAAFSSSRFIKKSKIQVLRISNVKNNILDLKKSGVFIDEINASENFKNELFPRDIIITMTGTRSKRDYCFTVQLNSDDFQNKRLFLNQRVGCFRLNHSINSTLATIILKSQALLEPVFNSSTGSANQANISKNALLNILIPLPPKKEQKNIVEKAEALMEKCTALEQEITQSEQHAQMLMQAVLKEAFEEENKILKPA